MKSFAIEGDQFVIRNGDRVVATTEGKLTGFLPTLVTLTPTFVFPDVPKDYAYHWEWLSDFTVFGNKYGWAARCDTAITARPQEYSTDIVLMAIPSGTNLQWGSITLARIGAPSHTWLEQAIDPLIPMGVKIPLTGSMLVEAAIGMSRTLTIMLSGSNLIARLEQSVSTPAGGYDGTYGSGVVGTGSDTSGGQNKFGSAAGSPILARDAKGGSGTVNDDAPSAYVFQYRDGFGNPCATNDITNYSSTYAATIELRFGRFT